MKEFPRTTVGGVSLPRLIIGTNWFLGGTHTSLAKTKLNLAWMNRGRIADILTAFVERGVDAILGIPDPTLLDAMASTQDRTGRKLILIATPWFNLNSGGAPELDFEPVLVRCVEIDATFCMPHMAVTDALMDLRAREIRELSYFTERIRERGMIPGLSTHMPETVIIADEMDADVETYIQPYNAGGFLMHLEADWVMRIIQEARKPVMTIKALAAGRIIPPVGLAFVWNTIRDRDMVVVGTSSADEAREVVDLSLSFIAHEIPKLALQATRSKARLKLQKDLIGIT